MVLEPIACPHCGETESIRKRGWGPQGKQRYFCGNQNGDAKSFILEYSDLGRLKTTKERIIEMSMNASGVRDIARVLKISANTVIEEIKKKGQTQVGQRVVSPKS